MYVPLGFDRSLTVRELGTTLSSHTNKPHNQTEAIPPVAEATAGVSWVVERVSFPDPDRLTCASHSVPFS